MPINQINYQNTIIYKIVCKDVSITECYVGHTTDFKSRKYSHKSDCNNINRRHYNTYVYQFIRETGNWDNWNMIEIEKYPCNDALEAHKKERYWIETLQSKLNSVLPTKTDEEFLEYSKNYKNDNKEYFYEYNKKYREEHKEELLEYNKKYHAENIEKILAKRQEKITCICGSVCNKVAIKRHEKTNKHIEYIKQNIKS